MFDNHIIQIRPGSDGGSIRGGIVMRDERGFRFFAATPDFERLHGQLFDNSKAAQLAALHRMMKSAFGPVYGEPVLLDRDDNQGSPEISIGADV